MSRGRERERETDRKNRILYAVWNHPSGKYIFMTTLTIFYALRSQQEKRISWRKGKQTGRKEIWGEEFSRKKQFTFHWILLDIQLPFRVVVCTFLICHVPNTLFHSEGAKQVAVTTDEMWCAVTAPVIIITIFCKAIVRNWTGETRAHRWVWNSLLCSLNAIIKTADTLTA